MCVSSMAINTIYWAESSMSSRVQRMVVGPRVENFSETDKEEEVLDWTSCSLPDDVAISIFSRLSYRDRASLSSTCRSWRAVGNSPCQWQALDLRPYNCDAKAASSLASRCENLQKLRLGCPESADAIINLQARNLQELIVENCVKMMDRTLGLIAARCPQLKRLWISGVREADANAINAFAENCKNLTDIGFVDCSGKVDVAALGNVESLKFISVAGTTINNWDQVVHHWSKLPCLIGLDVSRTDIPSDIVSGFFSSSFRLKVLCALNCPRLGDDATFVSNEKDSEISNWLDWIISSSLLCVSKLVYKRIPWHFCNFLLNQGTDLLLSFLQSAQDEVQERAVMALANFLAYDKNSFTVAFMRSGDGIRFLLNLAWSWREELQSGAAKVIASLSVNDEVVKALLEKGGISILANLARSANRSVAKEALVALSNLEGAIDEVIGAKALVQLTRIRHVGVRKKAACALRNLCCDDRNREAVAEAGGVEAMVALANASSNAPRELQWSAAGALWELSRSEAFCISICQEGGVASLIALAKSDDTAVNVYPMAALWRLAFYPINALRIIEESGIDTIARFSYSSSSCNPKATRLFSALALTCMFDQRMDEIVRMGGTCTNIVELERARRIATKHIEAFVKSVSDSQFACIREASELIFSEAEIGRFVAMLQNPCPAMKSCVAFALGQFTVPGATNGPVHVRFLRNAGAQSVLQQAAAKDELLETKIFAQHVLQNMEWFSYFESGHPASSLGWLNHVHRRERIGNENHCVKRVKL